MSLIRLASVSLVPGHPGGNITGTSSIAADLVGKQFQLLKRSYTEASRIAALWNPANFDFQIVQVKEAEIAAQQSGVQLQLIETRGPNEFDAAFAAIDRATTQALLILTDLFVIHHQPLINSLAKRPAHHRRSTLADNGSLDDLRAQLLQFVQASGHLC